MSEAELSGRISDLEAIQSYVDQQILLRPDISAVSELQAQTNQELDLLADYNLKNSNRISVLESKYINQSIELAALRARVSTGIVSGLVVTGRVMKGSIAITGLNGLDISTSGQTIIYNPGYITRTFSLSDPQTGDSFTLLYNDSKSLYFKEIRSTVQGTVPEVYWNLYMSTDRSSTGNLVTSISSLSTTTGFSTPGVTTYSIPSGNYLWMSITGLQGLVNELFCKISLGN